MKSIKESRVDVTMAAPEEEKPEDISEVTLDIGESTDVEHVIEFTQQEEITVEDTVVSFFQISRQYF